MGKTAPLLVGTLLGKCARYQVTARVIFTNEYLPRIVPGSSAMKALLLFTIALLSGCGVATVSTSTAKLAQQGNSSSPAPHPPAPAPSPPPPPLLPQNVAGIWDVNDTVDGHPVTEVALMAGGMFFSLATADQNGCTSISGGTYTIDGQTFNGTGVTEIRSVCMPPSGLDYYSWTLSGYETNGALNLTLTAGSSAVPTLGATLDPLYNLYTSSIATLVGNWNDAGNVLSVNPDGTFFEQQGNGCTVSGAYTVIDPTHNLYGVSFLFDAATCTNSIAGIQFTGLAYLTPNSSSGWYHLLEDASGVSASGALVVVVDSITPYFTPPTG